MYECEITSTSLQIHDQVYSQSPLLEINTEHIFCVFTEANKISWKHVLCLGSLLDTEKSETWILAFTHRFTEGERQHNIGVTGGNNALWERRQPWLWPSVEARVTTQECSVVTWAPFLRLSEQSEEFGGGARKGIPAVRVTSHKQKEITWRSEPSGCVEEMAHCLMGNT